MESNKKKILIVDDEKDLCTVLNHFLTRKGYDVTEAYKGKKAVEIVQNDMPDLILCDFRLEDMNGKEVLKAVKEINPRIQFIMITGFNNIKAAVEVIRMGAVDYIVKPLIPDEIMPVIVKALSGGFQSAVRQQEEQLNKANGHNGQSGTSSPPRTNRYIFGNSPYFKTILQQIQLVAPTNYSVIIYGESGSGKEAIAHEIHNRSRRNEQPFVAIDCGVLSKDLASSELFGHEKGSFTGAVTQKVGSFEIANGGTIFLDEVANLSYEVQITLLRVIQERKMRRVGGLKDIDLDVRLILASNEKLWDANGNGKIREDLFHRFNEFMINVPPLRDRKDDIMIFAHHFLELSNEELKKDIKDFEPEVEGIFIRYPWFGNLRELKNVVKRAALLCQEDIIGLDCLPFEIVNFSQLENGTPDADIYPEGSSVNRVNAMLKEKSLKVASIDAEYELILNALKKVNFNKSKAAKILQIDRKTLYYKIKQYQDIVEQKK